MTVAHYDSLKSKPLGSLGHEDGAQCVRYVVPNNFFDNNCGNGYRQFCTLNPDPASPDGIFKSLGCYQLENMVCILIIVCL